MRTLSSKVSYLLVILLIMGLSLGVYSDLGMKKASAAPTWTYYTSISHTGHLDPVPGYLYRVIRPGLVSTQIYLIEDCWDDNNSDFLGIHKTYYGLLDGTPYGYDACFPGSLSGSLTVERTPAPLPWQSTTVSPGSSYTFDTNNYIYKLNMGRQYEFATIRANGADIGLGFGIEDSLMTPSSGTYTITAVEYSDGTTPYPYSFEIYRMAYNTAPTVSLSSNANQTISNNGTVTLSGNTSDAEGNTITVSASIGGVAKTASVNGSGAWSLTWNASELANGAYSFIAVTATDSSGLSSSTTYTGTITVDKNAPSAPTITASTAWTNAASVSATIAAGVDTGGSGVSRTEYQLSNATISAWTTYSVTFNIVNAGSTTITARTIDNVGNVSATSTKTVQIDRTNPTVAFGTNGSEVYSETSSSTVTFADAASGVNAATLQYTFSTSTTTPASGWQAFTNGATLTTPTGTNGDYYLHVRGNDNAGNLVNQRSNRFRLQQIPPVITLTTSDKNVILPNSRIRLNLSITDNGSVASSNYKVYLNGSTLLSGPTLSGTGALDGAIVYLSSTSNPSIVENASLTIRITATDNIGNTSSKDLKVKIDSTMATNPNSL